MGDYKLTQLQGLAHNSEVFPVALVQSNEIIIIDTVWLLKFICRINKLFHLNKKLAPLQGTKNTTVGQIVFYSRDLKKHPSIML